MPSLIYATSYSRRYLRTIPFFMYSHVNRSGKLLEYKVEAFSPYRSSYATLSLNTRKVDHADHDASTCMVYHLTHGNPSNRTAKVYINYASSFTCQERNYSHGPLFKETRQVYDDDNKTSTCVKNQVSYGSLSKETGKIYNKDDHDGVNASNSGSLSKQAGEINHDDGSSIYTKHCFSYENQSLNTSIKLTETKCALSDVAKTVSSLFSGENPWRAEIEIKLERIIVNVTPMVVMEVVKGIEDPSMALHFLNWSRRREGYEPTCEAFTHIIARLTRKRNFNDAWCLLKEMKGHHLKPDYAFSIFIHRLKRARNAHGLVKAMCGMDFLKVTPTISLYTCALEFLLKQNHSEDVEYLYARMLQDGLVPDKKLFEILIKGCSKIGKFDAAVLFLESMKNQGLVPHLSVYITSICQMSLSGNLECGHRFYKEMIASGCLPNVFGIHEVACALYGDEVMQRIEEFENVLHKVPSILRVHSFNNLIWFLLNIGKPDEAKIVFNRLKSNTSSTSEDARKTPTWIIESYRIYIFGMFKLGHVINAMDAFKELLRRGPKPTSDISSFLLLNLSSEKLIDEALDVCKRIIKCRDPISNAAQKSFFTMLRIEKHLDIACKLFITMRKKRCIDDDADFVSLVGFNDDSNGVLAS